jgi:porin
MAPKSPGIRTARAAAALAIVVQAVMPAAAWATAAPASDTAAAVTLPASSTDWATRETLTGDWGGARGGLKDSGIVVKPRLTQFVQGLSAGDGEHGYEYGGKADLGVAADLGKLGFWRGFSMTLQAEYNFGRNVNGRGGVLIPVNAALNAPGMEGSDAFDLSSAYFRQDFSNDVSLIFGKVNMIELVSVKPFMGGAGIDTFWNQSFVATPTGTVPPYLFGALMSVFKEPATYRLWVYDPNSAVNKTIGDAFDGGVSVRASVDFNVRLGGLRGHQGFTAFYSTQKGADLESLDDVFLPTPDPGAITYKDKRWYVAYSFDQYAYQPAESPGEGFGWFGSLGVSDGNPNALRWSMLLGIGGRGLVPGRSRDSWGIGYYHDGLAQDLKDALAPAVTLRDEQGLELFYNFALTPWAEIGADLQVIRPGLASSTAVVPGLRAVIRF